MSPLRIIFMGTPEFAVPSLEALVAGGCSIVAVVTATDKPQGRGQELRGSPVKECALSHNIPVLQPTNLKSEEFVSQLRQYRADLQVVVAFRMLPEVVWAMPPLGTFNLHASLLPQYRGAAPINWAIINGEKETGLTTFFLRHEIDTGSIIFQEKETIQPDDDAGTLYERLRHKGAGLVLKTVQSVATGTVQPSEQRIEKNLKAAPKIFKETCQINWGQSAASIRNFVRGLSPYPGAWTIIENKVYKIYRVTGHDSKPFGDTYRTDNKTYLYFSTTDGAVSVEELQPEGKRRMSIGEFFRGNKLETGK